jgi:glycosyltransferase involved in cell wall biosynthesis
VRVFEGVAVTDCRKCDVSIVVPVKNEEDSIPQLAEEISAAFDGGDWTWECLWIDDGSTDGTLERLKALHAERPSHHFVSLVRNCGQTAALMTGGSLACGRIVGTLDGDLQNDPSDLPKLIHVLESTDAHMVNGVRAERRDTALRRISSKVANAFRNRVSGATATDVGCSVRVFYRECLDGVPAFRGAHRFLPTLVAMRGWRLAEVPVRHRERAHGTTSYGVHSRLWVGIVDTLGVRWLVSRNDNPTINEASVAGGRRRCSDD